MAQSEVAELLLSITQACITAKTNHDMKHTATKAEQRAVLDAVFTPLVPVESVVSLRRKATNLLRSWTRIMKRAEEDMRSGDEREAIRQVTWLKGYLKGLRHAEQANQP